jgi:hypothetical protein
MTDLHLDHLRYLRNQPYRRRVHARLRRLVAERRGKVADPDVLHVLREVDDRCCRREPWALTYVLILQALAADGERVAGLVSDAGGVSMIVPPVEAAR